MMGARIGQRPVPFSGIQVHHWGVDPTHVPLDDRRSFVSTMLKDIHVALNTGNRPPQYAPVPLDHLPPAVAKVLQQVDRDTFEVITTAITLPPFAKAQSPASTSRAAKFDFFGLGSLLGQALKLARSLSTSGAPSRKPSPPILQAPKVESLDDWKNQLQFMALTIHNLKTGETDLMALSRDDHDEAAFGVLSDDLACYAPFSMLNDKAKLKTTGFQIPPAVAGATQTGAQLWEALARQTRFIAYRLGQNPVQTEQTTF